MVAAHTISKNAQDWLTGALDPFHDFQYTPEGLPDTFDGNSVVQFIKRKVSIAAPAGIGANNWDCHIFTAPLMTSNVARYHKYQPGFTLVDSTAAVDMSLGTVNVYKALANSDLLPNTEPAPLTYTLPTNFSSICVSPTDNANDFSLMRIIGGGFEVHNDTAELYKKGNVVVYAQPTGLKDQWGTYSFANAGNSFANAQWKSGRLPPVNVDAATSNVNSVSWSAAEGCYVPFRLSMDRVEFQQTTSDMLMLAKTDNSMDYATYTPSVGITGTKVTSVDAGGPVLRARSSDPVRFSSLDTTGAYFTGLGPETVLTLDIRFIVEIAPTPANQTLISLASPSSSYEPAALALYARAVSELPPGTKVSNNASGDWWKQVSAGVKAIAPVVGSAGPYGALASAVLGGITAVGDTVSASRQRQKEKKAERTAPPSRAAPSTNRSQRTEKPKSTKEKATDRAVDLFIKNKYHKK